jgi:hypothetical protein
LPDVRCRLRRDSHLRGVVLAEDLVVHGVRGGLDTVVSERSLRSRSAAALTPSPLKPPGRADMASPSQRHATQVRASDRTAAYPATLGSRHEPEPFDGNADGNRSTQPCTR